MGHEGGDREEGALGGHPSPQGEARDLCGSHGGELDSQMSGQVDLPDQSPLFHAQQAGRYERQRLISEYEAAFSCRLIVLIDAIFPYGTTFLEELIFDADPTEDLHMLLHSPGGDGETAVRLVRSCQARCRELTVVVPDFAKSAGTLLAIGAHHIVMGPMSDLGPVDPQFQLPDGSLAAAKDIIAAVDDATAKVEAAPETYALHASLLADVTALMVHQARAALERTDALVEEALSSCTGRKPDEVHQLQANLHEPLIELPATHAAIFGADDAAAAGLPVDKADPQGEQWQRIWRLWTKYFEMGLPKVYEGRQASHVVPWPQFDTGDE
jgi:Serine dehydrogenase proteinase